MNTAERLFPLSAILLGLVASCKAKRVGSWAWLCDVFRSLSTLPSHKPEHLNPLLPDRSLLAHP